MPGDVLLPFLDAASVRVGFLFFRRDFIEVKVNLLDFTLNVLAEVFVPTHGLAYAPCNAVSSLR